MASTSHAGARRSAETLVDAASPGRRYKREFALYTSPMVHHAPEPTERSPDPDLIDRFPVVTRTTSQLERSFGPSCLLSMVIVLLIVLVLKRYMQLPWTALALLTMAVWFAVLVLLVRWRPDQVEDDVTQR